MTVLMRVDIAPSDAVVNEVRFRANDILVGVVTNAPFSVWLEVEQYNTKPTAGMVISATAVVNGLPITAEPARIFVTGGPPPFLEYEILSPWNGEIIPFRQALTITVDLIARYPGLFYIAEILAGTNVLGSFNTQNVPYSLAAANLPLGTHVLTVNDRDSQSRIQPVQIRVAELGIQNLQTRGGAVRVDIVTAYPGRATVLQRSANLTDWIAVTSHSPASNRFQFVDPTPLSENPRFYRLLVPGE